MTEKAKAGILSDIDWEAFKSGEKINVDSHQLMLLLGTMEAVRGSWRTMENPISHKQKEQEELSESMQEGVGVIRQKMKIDESLKNLKNVHHELTSWVPRLENDLKHLENFVLVTKQLRGTVDADTYAALSDIIVTIIENQTQKLEKIVSRFEKSDMGAFVTSAFCSSESKEEEDAGI